MESYTTTYLGSPGHFLGDPTITEGWLTRRPPRPRLGLQEQRHHQEFRSGWSSSCQREWFGLEEDLVFKNMGEADLDHRRKRLSAPCIDLDGTFPWASTAQCLA